MRLGGFCTFYILDVVPTNQSRNLMTNKSKSSPITSSDTGDRQHRNCAVRANNASLYQQKSIDEAQNKTDNSMAAGNGCSNIVSNGNTVNYDHKNKGTDQLINTRLSREFNQLQLAVADTNSACNSNGHSNVYQNISIIKSYPMQISPSSSASSNSLGNSTANMSYNNLANVTVNEGNSAILSCRLKNCHYSKITWRKTEPESYIIRQDEKYDLSVTPIGEARLIVKHTRISDSGVYVCTIENGLQTATSSPYYLQFAMTLLVVATSHYEPILGIVDPKTISVSWRPANPCLIEYCRIGETEWKCETTQPVMPNYEIRNLKPDESYSFRLTNPASGMVGVSSLTLTLPANDSELWQQQHFSHRYTILSELGRGRCAVVKLARDTGTGQLVASKQISRNLQSISKTQSEYKIISAIQHTNIVKGLCLYQNSPHPGTDTIVMEYVHGPYLFSYICKNKEYTETTVQFFVKQLLNAVSWIHGQHLLHLDIKPENVLVDVSNIYSPVLKLIDFGNYIKYTCSEPLQLNNLEFAAPETLMENQLLIGRHTDIWAIGVFLYVFLSGVSPFLDDSSEETTTNILKCDYCFPEEYFKGISSDAIQLAKSMLVVKPENRISVENALQSSWITQNLRVSVIKTARLLAFVERRTPSFNVPVVQNANKFYPT